MNGRPVFSSRRPELLFGVVGWLAQISTMFVFTTSLHAAEPVAARKPVPRSQRLLFEANVLPIFKARCIGCHNEKARKADLNLKSFAGVLAGGESGAIVVRKKSDESLLYEMVHDRVMPPDGKKPLTKTEIATIRRWIDTGAHSSQTLDGAAAESMTQHDVIPILSMRCTVCHGLRRQEAGLDLRTKASMLKGGKSGPALVLGKPEESPIIKRIRALDMPPPEKLVDYGVRPVEPSELDVLTKWIAAGAPEVVVAPDVATIDADSMVTDADRNFWSFRPPARPPVPVVKHQQSVRNAVDAFILRRLESRKLSFSDVADRLTLIRRVAFDLTGLPPEWDDVERFLADESPTAYDEMVERYLASPHYGERWGRFWLDLAGYADSEGKRSADPVRPHAWRYRDYVVRAFNSDKPYDRFLLQQLAGDELLDYEHASVVTPEIQENLVATGFLRMAPDGTGSDIVNTTVERMEVVADEIDVFSSVVLGLTIRCAQCHSHKYDPIPQRDYYRLVAVFKGAYDEHDWLTPAFLATQTKFRKSGRVLPHVVPKEIEAWQQQKKPFDAKIVAVKDELKVLRLKLIDKYRKQRLDALPAEIRDDVRAMLSTPGKKRTVVQKYLVSKFEKNLTIDTKALRKIDAKFRKREAAVNKTVKGLRASIPKKPMIRALWDRGVPSPTYIYRRGEVTSPGRLVGPGVPSVLTDGKTPFVAKPPWQGSIKTGRRRALAEWLIDPDHPLTARVMVNRIWKHHFGQGLVKSLANFGKTGTRPSHPELLDWLAREFVEADFSIKQMHRLMLHSSAYRQVSHVNPQLEQSDPENKLLGRMPLKRMEAEVVRDSILAVSGELEQRAFGKPNAVDVRSDGLVTSRGSARGWRRSVYIQHRRSEIPTILENFDLPQMMPNCIERPNSTVASQALHLLNDSMIRRLSRRMAERIVGEVGDDQYRQAERVFQLALSRLPSEEERQLSAETLARLTKQWTKKNTDKSGTEQNSESAKKALANYCHTIINSAAFLYVD